MDSDGNYYVYRHTNKINGKVYIGITKQIPEQRWGNNGINYKQSTRFYSAIEKYGWDNFSHEILYRSLSKEEACKIEIDLIREFKAQERKFGYNIQEGGVTPTMSEEVKQKISNSLKGNKNSMGIRCSEEKRQKISNILKGKKFTEEHKRNISIAKRGKSHAPLSMESRKKISNAHEKKKVYCVELDKEFPSIQECAREMKIEATVICRCCKGRLKSTHGYHFRYA